MFFLTSFSQLGGNAWNEYIFEANDELEIKLARLPYL